MASVRACAVIAMLACFLLMRSEEVAARMVKEKTPEESAIGSSVRTSGHQCNPAIKACRPGDPDSFENEAEESTLDVAPSSDDDETDFDDATEAIDQDLVVLGH